VPFVFAIVEDCILSLGIAVADHKCPISGSRFSFEGILMIGFGGPRSTHRVARNLGNPVHLHTVAEDRSPYHSADSWD
jgi:hypothetical protein